MENTPSSLIVTGCFRGTMPSTFVSRRSHEFLPYLNAPGCSFKHLEVNHECFETTMSTRNEMFPPFSFNWGGIQSLLFRSEAARSFIHKNSNRFNLSFLWWLELGIVSSRLHPIITQFPLLSAGNSLQSWMLSLHRPGEQRGGVTTCPDLTLAQRQQRGKCCQTHNIDVIFWEFQRAHFLPSPVGLGVTGGEQAQIRLGSRHRLWFPRTVSASTKPSDSLAAASERNEPFQHRPHSSR